MSKKNPDFGLIWIKIKLSAKNLLWVYRKPAYLALTVIMGLAFFELVYWMFNLHVLTMLLTSNNLDLFDKVGLFISPFGAVWSSSGRMLFILMIILSIIQGLSLSALIYAIKNQPKVDSKMIEGSAIVSLLAIIGLGCPACGTSLITPIVAMFASGSAVAVSEQITAIAVPLAIAIGLYGLYHLGSKIATIKVSLEQKSAKG